MRNRSLSSTRFLGLLCLLFFPAAVLAADQSGSTTINLNFFDIPQTDYSIYFLGTIFGTVGSVLHGSSQLLGVVFNAFNNAVLALGGIVVLYTIIVSTINTAIDGEALGKKWSSMWVPLRAAMGFALLVPGSSGYSLVQVFFMWVVVQGVGAADHVWATAVNYFDKGGSVYDASLTPNPVTYLQPISQVLQNVACVTALQDVLAKTAPNANLQMAQYNQTSNSFIFQFPGAITGISSAEQQSWGQTWSPGVCGTMSVSNAAMLSSVVNTVSGYVNAAGTQVFQDSQSLLAAITAQGGNIQGTQANQLIQVMLNAVTSYANIVSPLRNQLSSNDAITGGSQLFQEMKQKGWIMAGSYFYDIYNLQSSASSALSFIPSVSVLIKSVILPNNASTTFEELEKGVQKTQQLIGNMMNDTRTVLEQQRQEQQSTANTLASYTASVHLGADAHISGAAAAIIDIVTGNLSDIASQWNTYFNSDAASSDPGLSNPLNKIAIFGNVCLQVVERSWIVGSAILFSIGFLSGLVPCIGAAVNLLVMWIVPIVSTAMALLLGVGFVLAYYVPMIPFILFTFGGLGWMIGVIESMCAAPIVALGLAHPEGHDTWGKAEPAVMLMINLFMRPSLMIIGMLAGMTLCFVAVTFLNAGFSYAFGQMLKATGVSMSSITGLFPPIGVMMLYTGLILVVVQKTFSLVNIIPDKVLRWIEGGAAVASAFGEETQGMEQTVRQGYSSGASAAGQGVSQSYQSSQDLGQTAQKQATSSSGQGQGGGSADGAE